MGKVQHFSISFNNERQVYYPGEQLSGNVVLVLKEPMETRAIKMEFEGIHYFCISKRLYAYITSISSVCVIKYEYEER